MFVAPPSGPAAQGVVTTPAEAAEEAMAAALEPLFLVKYGTGGDWRKVQWSAAVVAARCLAALVESEAVVAAMAAALHARWKDEGCAHVGKWHQCTVDAKTALAALTPTTNKEKTE